MKQGDCDLVASYIDPDDADNIEFIWGVKAADDITDTPACLYSMNDIDLIYIKSSGLYELGVETIYHFRSFDEEHDYLLHLLDEFERFMLENGYDTTESPAFISVFGNMKFVSIEQAYATFKSMTVNYLLDKMRKEVIRRV